MASDLKRPIGQILTDAGLLSRDQLEQALEEQKRSNELLGQVLVRMGILDEGEVKVALSVQEHLGSLDQAVRLAAGVSEMLGALLIRAGQISPEQLESALAEQMITGEKLGEVCVRRGLLSEQQLQGLLDFQQQQHADPVHPNPLRLGELLVTAGYVSRENLEHALRKQAVSRKKLGEVLVEEGYAHPTEVTHGVRMQHLLMSSVLAAVVSLAALTMSGCGSAQSSSTAPAAVSSRGVTSAPLEVSGESRNYFSATADRYPLIAPTFYYSTCNDSFWSIQANLAKTVTDTDTLCVFRIDIPKKGATMPALNRTFSIEEGTQFDRFPGEFSVFNGQKSATKKVERGVISFSPDSVADGRVTGTFDVTLSDYDSVIRPVPQYRLTGSFNFVMGSYGPATTGV